MKKSLLLKSTIIPRWFSPNRFSSAVRIATASTLVVAAAAMCSIALNAGNGGGGSAPSGSTDNFNQGPSVDTSSAIVVLKGDPLAQLRLQNHLTGRKSISIATP